MKIRCEICKKPTDSFKLSRCQAKRCADIGPVFCEACLRTEGTGITAKHVCINCKARAMAQEGKEARKLTKPRKVRSEPIDTPLSRLRKHLGTTQAEMAKWLGLKHRQYQVWESGDIKISLYGKKLLWMLCNQYVPDFKHYFAEGEVTGMPRQDTANRIMSGCRSAKTKYGKSDWSYDDLVIHAGETSMACIGRSIKTLVLDEQLTKICDRYYLSEDVEVKV